MTGFLLRRFCWFLVTTWIVITVSFFLMRAVPGGPFDNERTVNAAIERNMKARYHLDWSPWKQYVHYLGPFSLDEKTGATWAGGDGSATFGGLLTGDFGPSFKYRDFSVNDIIGQSLPISVALGTVAMFWALLLGLSAGILSAVWRGSTSDLGIRLISTIGIAVPNFIVALFLITLFVFKIDLFPVAGWGSLRHLFLPGLALGGPFAAYVARLTRTGMLEVLSQEYIRTAYAKGLSPAKVLMRHALKGGLLPVVSFLGPATAGILTGSLVIEKIFAIPGTGTHFVNSALNRDYTLAMGVTILYTVLVYGLNTIVDLAYTFLDPRIKLEDA